MKIIRIYDDTETVSKLRHIQSKTFDDTWDWISKYYYSEYENIRPLRQVLNITNITSADVHINQFFEEKFNEDH